jgi:hypothetical protein
VDGLIAFLRARLADDEQVAREAAGAQWRIDAAPDGGFYIEPAGGGDDIGKARQVEHAAHIARWDPARALAEVEAKRRILDHVAQELEDRGADNPWWYSDKLTPILDALVLPYAEHPDYREAWRLEE